MEAAVLQHKNTHSSVVLSEEELQNLNDMVSKVANFIAMYESASHKIEQTELVATERLLQSDELFDSRLGSIDERLGDFYSVLTEAGVARWRLIAEESLNEGKTHIKKMESIVKKIEVISDTTVAQIKEAGKVLALEEIKEVTDECTHRISEETDGVIQRLNRASSWFHWQRIATVLVTVILSAFIITCFTNDQLPWETHQQVAMEREAGQAILHAWPQLSKKEQEDIQRYA